MSADSWSICPNCMRLESKKHEKYQKELEDSYGKIPLEEFNSKREALEKLKENEKLEQTSLREDYEFYLKDSELLISYIAQCGRCGFKFKYENNINILKGE